MKGKDLLTLSDFYCTCCGNKGIPVFRRKSKERESGHLKKLFCIYCQADKNMVEIRNSNKYTLDDFLIEFNGHNFTEDGQRILPYKQFISSYKRGDINETETLHHDGNARIR